MAEIASTALFTVGGQTITVGIAAAVTAAVGSAALSARARRRALAAASISPGTDVRLDSQAGDEIPLLYGRTATNAIRVFPGETSDNLPYVPSQDVIGGVAPERGSRNQFLMNQYDVSIGDIEGVYNVWNIDQPIVGTEPPQSGSLVVEWKNGGEASDMATRFCSSAGFGGIPGNGTGSRNANSKFTGLNFLTSIAKYDLENPQVFAPPEWLCALEGRLLRTIERSGNSYSLSASRSFDTNVVKVLLDYLLSEEYGAGLALEDIHLPSFYLAQQQAGQPIQGPGSGVDSSENAARRAAGYDYVGTDGQLNEAGYGPGVEIGFAAPSSTALTPRTQLPRNLHRNEFNGALFNSEGFTANIQNIRAAMPDARLFWSREGKYKISLGDPTRTPAQQSVYTITPAALDGSVTVIYPSNQQKKNLVTLSFLDIEKDYAENTATWPKQGGTLHNRFKSEDGGEELHQTFFLLGCNNHFHASSIAATHLLLTRRTLYQFDLNAVGEQLEEGSVIRVQEPAQNLDVYVRILTIKKSSILKFSVIAAEFHQADYAWTYDEATVLSNLALESDEVGRLQSVTVTAQQQRVTVNWTPNENESINVTAYEIERSDDGGMTWSGAATVARDATSWVAVADVQAVETLSYRVRPRTPRRVAPWREGNIVSLTALVGQGGSSQEIVYRSTSSFLAPDTPTSTTEQDDMPGYVPTGWSGTPVGISAVNRFEWISVRTRPEGSTTFGKFSTPRLFARWATNGNGYEFIYRLTQTASAPATPSTSAQQDATDEYLPSGWVRGIPDRTAQARFVWVSVREGVSGDWGKFRRPTLFLQSVEDGKGVEYIFNRTSNANRPSTPSSQSAVDDYVPPGWTDDPVDVSASNPYLWISGRVGSTGNWGAFSTPRLYAQWVRGEQGDQGERGEQGPRGLDGSDGIDGSSIEFVFRRSSTLSRPAIASTSSANRNRDEYVPPNWTDDPTGVTNSVRYEWVSRRTRDRGAGAWGEFSTPALWAIYAEDGQDGAQGATGARGQDGDPGVDGASIEFVFRRTTTDTRPSTPSSTTAQRDQDDYVPSGWTDDPVGVTSSSKFEWVSQRTRDRGAGQWNTFSRPSLWATFSEDGEKGDTGDPGTDGVDGASIEFIFRRTADNTTPSRPSSTTSQRNQDDYVPSGWTDNAVGVDANDPFEWVCQRVRARGSTTWSQFSNPGLWATFNQNTGGIYNPPFIRSTDRATVVNRGGDNYIRLTWGSPRAGSRNADGALILRTGYSGTVIRYGAATASIEYGAVTQFTNTVDIGPVEDGNHLLRFGADYPGGYRSVEVSFTVRVT